MIAGLFKDSIEANNKSRQNKQSVRILKFLSKTNIGVTIPEVAKHVKISVPTTTKLMNELINKKYIIDQGKKETDNGRKPVLYILNHQQFHAVGVEILFKRIRVKVLRLDKKVIYDVTDDNFILANTEPCLNHVINFIKKGIDDSGIDKEQIMGVGIGVTGRVNKLTGETMSYFNFMQVPFSKMVNDAINIPVIVDNDTRILGIAEQVSGKASKANNALVVNISRGIGVSIIINEQVVTGGSGFAGELGHMQMNQSNRLCQCGKQGCLETIISGHAMEVDLQEALLSGEQSIYFNQEHLQNYRYSDILNAAKNGDALALSIIQKQGDILGQALGNLVNLLNPELIILSGKIVAVGHLFSNSVRMGLTKTALINPMEHCSITVSELENTGVPDGAAYMLWKNFEMI